MPQEFILATNNIHYLLKWSLLQLLSLHSYQLCLHSRLSGVNVCKNTGHISRTSWPVLLGGGSGWTGATACASGSCCTFSNPYYSQCIPCSGGGNPTTTKAATTANPTSVRTTSAAGPTTTAGSQPGGCPLPSTYRWKDSGSRKSFLMKIVCDSRCPCPFDSSSR